MTAKTILVGLDGATFTILDPFMERGVMPFLRDFVASGVRATLRSVVPALTPPAWTSLMTGKHPGEHGVFDFFQKEAPDSRYFRFAVSQDVGSATIWSLASEHGQRVTALNFPLMFPPPSVHGCVVPGGWMPWRQLRLGCHPPGLFDRLKELPSFDARELALDMALEEKAIEGCADEEYADWIALHIRRERRWFDILRYVVREEPADLIGLLFDGVDKLQHLCWRFLDPAYARLVSSPWERQIRGLCEDYFRQLDGLIAEIVALAGSDATVVLASDHGFGPTSDVLYLNTWLEQQGYLAWAADGRVQSLEAPRVGLSQIARHVFELDWERTVAYAATPSSQGIHIVRRAPDSSSGVPPESYERVRAELAARLRDLRHPVTGRPVIAQTWTRDEVFAGPYKALAPDLSIALEENGVVSILRSDTVIGHRADPAGAHRPEGVFLARGPGMRSGVTLAECSIVDLGPLLLYCVGVPVPDDMTGRLPIQAIDPAELRRRPPVMAAALPASRLIEAAPAAVAGGEYDAEAEATLLKRLRALGYVE